MNRQELFKRLGTARAFMMATLKDLSPTQWTEIPEGFSNNILWNAAHVATTQARFLYEFSGLPYPLPEGFAEKSIRGTSPKEWTEALTPQEVLDVLERQVPQAVEDDRAGKFAQFTPRELRPGLTVDSFDDGILFNILHEGIHVGIIMQLKKLVK
jgi:hypothetical protein